MKKLVHFLALVFVLLSLLTGCKKPDPKPADELQPCNGMSSNCGKRYNEVSYAATHNAFTYSAGGPVHYYMPNQDSTITAQLRYGIRGFGLRPCPYFGTDSAEMNRVYVTHNSDLHGALGTEPLEDVLKEFKTFLEKNPREVVTFFCESSVTYDKVADAFEKSGIVPMLHVQNKNEPWPTLNSMIAQNKRIVMLNDDTSPNRPAWMHYMYDFIVDTDYNITNASQFKCNYYRGDSTNSLYFLNHFIYKDYGSGVVVPDSSNSVIANSNPLLLDRCLQCWQEKNRRPNFIYVDWYKQGNVMDAVNELNKK